MKLLEPPAKPVTTASATPSSFAAAKAACRRIAPLWPLKNFVAVNPFLGLTDKPFHEACELLGRITSGGMQMPLGYYRDKWQSGAIIERDVLQALALARTQLAGAWRAKLEAWNVAQLVVAMNSPSPEEPEILTAAETIDRAHGRSWSDAIIESISQFCSAYYDQGQSAWRLPWKSLPLYAAWREMAAQDASMEMLGLPDFRKKVAALPENPVATLDQALSSLRISGEGTEHFLHKQLMSVRGWAGHIQYLVREKNTSGQQDDSLLHLLAIRIVFDAALLDHFDGQALREFWPPCLDASTEHEAVLVKYLWQLAEEAAWLRSLSAKLFGAQNHEFSKSERPAVQAVFCIDVRSEILRRSLEAASPKIKTIGFAGFFGLPIEYIPFGQHHGQAQCPVLLKPAFKVRGAPDQCHGKDRSREYMRLRLSKRLSYAWNSFKTSAISCFSFVEAAGLASGPKMLRDAFALQSRDTSAAVRQRPEIARDEHSTPETGIALPDRVRLAIGALKNMGLTKNFARLVLLCGHGSDTVNNPYGSGLDCGACGGNAGDANARVGAEILNDPEVRNALKPHDIVIPDDTWFVAGLHHTTTDRVTLFDTKEIPASHGDDVQHLRSWLEQAGGNARRERATLLGLNADEPSLDKQVEQRSRDWSQVRPEWGLAGNAAFIAAPRSRTSGLNLKGRVFLHNYDQYADTDSSILELIMTAPMIVANWINLQYFASTVNNTAFGSGNKVTHNVVGILGVCQGNGGDLQTGLPLQSVHDGSRWIHEPLRLHVILEAPRERIDAVLAKHEQVRRLVENGWLILFALERDGRDLHRRLPSADWQPATPGTPS